MPYWVICYDIGDHVRRREVAEALADAGAIRVQESVFEGCFERRDMRRLIAQIAGMLGKAGGDSLRAYPLDGAADARCTLGRMGARLERSGCWIC